jgi:hypothetical protein
MINNSKFILIFILIGVFQFHSSFACKYNVRETGFVDLGAEPYLLNLYIDNTSLKEIVTSFQLITSDLLEDTNIKPQVVNLDLHSNKTTATYLKNRNFKSLPVIILVSPDGQSNILPVDFRLQSFKQSMKKIINNILFSSVMKHILKEIIDSYGIVLLLESKNVGKNSQAKICINKAIENIRRKMKLLPKLIKHPPKLLTLSNHQVNNEKILLWSLGLAAKEIKEPVAFVLYGRVRWIGPLFIGEKITSENISSILMTIGMDCECGLNKNWIQGTMLPVKWDQQIQNRVAKNLGFDPENPMIKMEINRIMRRGSSYPDVPLNYINENINPDSTKQKINETPVKQKVNDNSKTAKSKVTKESDLFDRFLYITSGLTVLIIAVGIFILYKNKNLGSNN